jgi:transketolase
VADGNDLEALDRALEDAASVADRPTMIIVTTVIADPAPTKRDTSEAHGAPLGKDEIERTKAVMKWPAEPFYVPDEARDHMRGCVERGDGFVQQWEERLARYREAYPDVASQLDAWFRDGAPALDWDKVLPAFGPNDALATRQASATTLTALLTAMPNLVGGSADLATSTGTAIKNTKHFTKTEAGPLIAWGVREHGMGSAMNGIAAHGGLRPFGSTFLVFADYVKPAIRLAALSKLPVIYVFTHDSIGVGEDGPTHQPIEHLAMLRSIPNVVLIRPGSLAETAQAWRVALERTDGPTILILTRQKLAPVDHAKAPAAGLRLGGYVLYEPPTAPRAIIISDGSEIGISMAAAKQLTEAGTATRVVSLPSWELFRAQDEAYRDSILPPTVRARVSVEAASTFGWSPWVTEGGTSIGIDHFGASAPGDLLFREFGITTERVVEAVNRVVARS